MFSNLSFGKYLTSLQVVLFSRYLFVPQLFLAFQRRACQAQSLLCGQQLTALISETLAGQHSKNLAASNPIAGIGRYRFDKARQSRHHMHSAVLVQPHFTLQLQRSLDARRPDGPNLNAVCLELCLIHGHTRFYLFELELMRLARLLCFDAHSKGVRLLDHRISLQIIAFLCERHDLRFAAQSLNRDGCLNLCRVSGFTVAIGVDPKLWLCPTLKDGQLQPEIASGEQPATVRTFGRFRSRGFVVLLIRMIFFVGVSIFLGIAVMLFLIVTFGFCVSAVGVFAACGLRLAATQERSAQSQSDGDHDPDQHHLLGFGFLLACFVVHDDGS